MLIWLKFSFSFVACTSCPMADMKNGSISSLAKHSEHIRLLIDVNSPYIEIPAIFRATPPKLVLILPGLVPSDYQMIHNTNSEVFLVLLTIIL